MYFCVEVEDLVFISGIYHVCFLFQAETAQQQACEKFEQMSDIGKEGKTLVVLC